MSTGVVIPQRLGTTKTLQQGVSSEDHVLDLLDTAILPLGNRSDVLHNSLRGLSLASARLSRDDDTLVVLVCLHVVVRALRNREDVGRNLESILATILVEHLIGVDTQICNTLQP